VQGNKVIVINGTWQSSNTADHGIFFPKDELGCEVQEIHFVAPPEIYDQFLPEFERVLASIKWN